jgi:hypothetical protein
MAVCLNDFEVCMLFIDDKVDYQQATFLKCFLDKNEIKGDFSEGLIYPIFILQQKVKDYLKEKENNTDLIKRFARLQTYLKYAYPINLALDLSMASFVSTVVFGLVIGIMGSQALFPYLSIPIIVGLSGIIVVILMACQAKASRLDKQGEPTTTELMISDDDIDKMFTKPGTTTRVPMSSLFKEDKKPVSDSEIPKQPITNDIMSLLKSFSSSNEDEKNTDAIPTDDQDKMYSL